MAQRRAQIVEQKAESAFSGVGVVADQTRRMQSVAEATIAEVRLVRDEVWSKMAAFAQRAYASTSSTVGILTGRV